MSVDEHTTHNPATSNAESPQPPPGLVAEYLEFLRSTWKWWLSVILLVAALIVWLIYLSLVNVNTETYPNF